MYMYCVTVVHEVKVNVNTHTDMCIKPFAAGLTTMRFYIEVENACTLIMRKCFVKPFLGVR